MVSRYFGTRKPAKDHLTRNGGSAGEIRDLRKDVEAAFTFIQNEQTGTPASFSPLSVPEIANFGSWWSASRGVTGLGTTAITFADQCANPLNLTTSAANGTPTLLPLGAPPVFVGTSGFTQGVGANNASPAAKLQATTELYVAGWFAVANYLSTICPMIAQYDATGGAGSANKMFMLHASSANGGSILWRLRAQDDSANLIVSYLESNLNEAHYIEGVYKNGRQELWKDRTLLASAAGPASLPNLLVPTSLFSDATRGNQFEGSGRNVYVSTRVPSDANRDLLSSFERLTPYKRRRYIQATPPALGANALGVVSTGAMSNFGVPFLVEGSAYSCRQLVATSGGGAFLGSRVTASNTLELQFLGPTTTVGMGFVLEV